MWKQPKIYIVQGNFFDHRYLFQWFFTFECILKMYGLWHISWRNKIKLHGIKYCNLHIWHLSNDRPCHLGLWNMGVMRIISQRLHVWRNKLPLTRFFWALKNNRHPLNYFKKQIMFKWDFVIYFKILTFTI